MNFRCQLFRNPSTAESTFPFKFLSHFWGIPLCPFPNPNPRPRSSASLPKPSLGRAQLDEAENLFDNQCASVASLRRVFAFPGMPFGFPLESTFTFTATRNHETSREEKDQMIFELSTLRL